LDPHLGFLPRVPKTPQLALNCSKLGSPAVVIVLLCQTVVREQE
jgi:hypothetical protein